MSKFITLTHLRSNNAITFKAQDVVTVREKEEGSLVILECGTGYYIREDHDTIVSILNLSLEGEL